MDPEKEKRIHLEARVFSFEILLNIIIFTVLGFTISVLFFSFNILAYSLLTGGGVVLGILVGLWTAQRKAKKKNLTERDL